MYIGMIWVTLRYDYNHAACFRNVPESTANRRGAAT